MKKEILPELPQKKKAFAEMLILGNRTMTQMADALNTTRQTLFAWKKEKSFQDYLEQFRRESEPVGLDTLDNMTPVQLSSLRRKLDEVERELDPLQNITGFLRRRLRTMTADEKNENNVDDERRDLFDEVINIFAEYGITPREKIMTIFIMGTLTGMDVKKYLEQCRKFSRWMKKKGIEVPKEFDAISDIYANGLAAIKLQHPEDIEA